MVSASSMPTTETLSKSSPLVTICVPIRMSALWLEKSLMMCSYCWRVFAVSRSMRRVVAPSNNWAICSSTFSVPTPMSVNRFSLQAGHCPGTGVENPQ